MRLSIKKRWVLEDGARRSPSYLSLPSSYMDNSSKFVFKKMREARNRLLKTQQYYLNRSSGYCIFLQSRFGFDSIFFKVGLDLVCNYVNVGLDLIRFSSKLVWIWYVIMSKLVWIWYQFSSMLVWIWCNFLQKLVWIWK